MKKGLFLLGAQNQRMSNIHGAVLVGQMRRIDEIVNDRISKANYYDELLENVSVCSSDSED